MRHNSILRRPLVCFTLAFCCTPIAAAATLEPLDLRLDLQPDLFSSGLTVSNRAVAGGWQLSVLGSNDNITLPNGTPAGLTLNVFGSDDFSPAVGSIDNRISLTANFDTNGDFVDGNVAVSGMVLDAFPATPDDAFDDPNTGANLAGTLLTGAVVAFGLEQLGSAGALQFAVDADAATPLGMYGLLTSGADTGIQVTLSSVTGAPLDWATELTTTAFSATGISNSVVVPLPAAGWLLGAVLLVLAGWRKRAITSRESTPCPI